MELREFEEAVAIVDSTLVEEQQHLTSFTRTGVVAKVDLPLFIAILGAIKYYFPQFQKELFENGVIIKPKFWQLAKWAKLGKLTIDFIVTLVKTIKENKNGRPTNKSTSLV